MQFSVRMELHENSMIDKHFSIYEKSLAVVVVVAAVGVVKDLNYPKMSYNHPNKNFVIYDSFRIKNLMEQISDKNFTNAKRITSANYFKCKSIFCGQPGYMLAVF